MYKYKEEQIRQSRFSITRYNVSSLFCISNMHFLSYTVVEISSIKYVERKMDKHIRINKREKAGSQSHDATSHCQCTYKTLTFYLTQLLRNILRKNTVLTKLRERKKEKKIYIYMED